MAIQSEMKIYWVGYLKGTTIKKMGLLNPSPTYITVVISGMTYKSAKKWIEGIRS